MNIAGLGLSAEDRYTVLAYHALRMLLAAHQRALTMR